MCRSRLRCGIRYASPASPNLELPAWNDTFLSNPRSTAQRPEQEPETSSTFERKVRFMNGMPRKGPSAQL